MAQHEDIRNIVDAILHQEKNLAGYGQWQKDTDGSDRFLRPVECAGELLLDFLVKSYSRRGIGNFRFLILFQEICIWRLDHCSFDDVHVNSLDRPDGLPLGPFKEPHCHTWRDNRRFATAASLPRKLHNANLLPGRVRTYEQAFRWFCGEARINVTAEDFPDPPKRDTLL